MKRRIIGRDPSFESKLQVFSKFHVVDPRPVPWKLREAFQRDEPVRSKSEGSGQLSTYRLCALQEHISKSRSCPSDGFDNRFQRSRRTMMILVQNGRLGASFKTVAGHRRKNGCRPVVERCLEVSKKWDGSL